MKQTIIAVAVLCASLYALVQAQTISGNTSNLINPAGTAWGIPGNQVLNSGGIGAIEGGGPTTGSAYYNQDTNTIRFSYMPSTVTQSMAITAALAGTGTGIKWLGYDYAWSIMNGGQASGPLRADIYLKSNNAVLETWTHNYAAGSQPAGSFQLYSGRQLFSQSGGYTTGQLASLDMSWTGQDTMFGQGLYGPRVRDTNIRLLYGVDQCVANPLSSPTCPNYATAYFTQQCTISALYNPACPGYAAAYFTQQCTISALYNPACPGYTQAYLAYQCSLDGLYSQSCPNYAEAYTKKNILNIGTTTTTATAATAVTESATSTAKTDPVTIATLNATTSATSPTSVTSVTSVITGGTTSAIIVDIASTSKQSTTSTTATSSTEVKKTDTEIQSITSAGATSTARARAEAAARQAAKAVSDARTFEAQTATQGLVVALMGFVPGFDAYGTTRITDINAQQMARLYNRPNVDNRAALRGLTGASDRLHSDMVDQQYQRGK